MTQPRPATPLLITTSPSKLRATKPVRGFSQPEAQVGFRFLLVLVSQFTKHKQTNRVSTIYSIYRVIQPLLNLFIRKVMEMKKIVQVHTLALSIDRN